MYPTNANREWGESNGKREATLRYLPRGCHNHLSPSSIHIHIQSTPIHSNLFPKGPIPIPSPVVGTAQNGWYYRVQGQGPHAAKRPDAPRPIRPMPPRLCVSGPTACIVTTRSMLPSIRWSPRPWCHGLGPVVLGAAPSHKGNYGSLTLGRDLPDRVTAVPATGGLPELSLRGSRGPLFASIPYLDHAGVDARGKAFSWLP